MADTEGDIKKERWRLLVNIKRALEAPMIVLSFVWLILVVLDLTKELPPFGLKIGVAIWIIFIIDFFISLIVAPDKKLFLKKNILTILSLIVPFLRALRIFQVIRLFRGVSLVRVLGSINRGMGGLAATMHKGAFGYVLLLTLLVMVVGAAGMYAFEPKGLNSYWEALWFTAMVFISIGTDYWPKTTEGRILCYLIALYGFAVLGYLTATIATFFIGRNEEQKQDKQALEKLEQLKQQIESLKELLNKSTR